MGTIILTLVILFHAFPACGKTDSKSRTKEASPVFHIQPGLSINTLKGEVIIKSKTCLDSGILEFLLIQGDDKEYEAVLSTQIMPSQIMSALILLNFHIGDTLELSLIRDNRKLSIYDLIRFRDPKKKKEPLRWQLTGSDFFEIESGKKKFKADHEGLAISLMDRPAAIMQLLGNYHDPYKNVHFGFEINTSAVPKKGTPVTVVLSKYSR